MVSINDVRHARRQIASDIRQTPLMLAKPLKQPPSIELLYLKLENLQICGSFKARGAVNKLLSLTPEEIERGIVTASGGNHGLGVAYAGWLARASTTIYLPHSTPAEKAQKLVRWGAKVIMEGKVWDDANRAALAAAEREGLVYFHPFADEKVIAGQGTLALEILEAVPDMDAILVAIGGGGLISGISLAAKAIRPQIEIIGIEPVGAPTLYESLRAGKLIELAEINTAAGTLAPRTSSPINFDIIRQYVDDIVLVTDEEMREAAQWLWFELGIAAELSGAAAVAAVLSDRVQFAPHQKVCALVCGAGTDGL